MATTLIRASEPDGSALTHALALVTARLRLQRWVRHASRGALGGIVVCLVAVVLAHFDLLPDWLPLEAVLPIALLLGIGMGTITAFAKPIPLMDAARLAESRLGLKERLSSALEFSQAPSNPLSPDIAMLLRLQQEDAATHARSLHPTEAVPLRWPWEAKAALAGLVLLLLALILPALPVFVPPGVKLERLIVQKSGQKLQKTARLIQKQAETLHLDGTRRAALNMQKLGQKMAAGRMDKKQAMVQMSKLTQQMKADQMKMAQANSGIGAGSKNLALAGQQLAHALQSPGAQNSGGNGGKPGAGAGSKSGSGGGKGGQKNGQGGGKNGKDDSNKFSGFNTPGGAGHKGSSGSSQNGGSPSTPEMQKAAQAMQQNNPQGLSDQLRQLASRTESGQMSAGEQQQAAQDLQKLSNALQNAGMPETQKHAQAAANALKKGDRATAASEMRKAADAAEREQQEQQDQSGMQQAEDSTQGSEGEMADANSPGDISDSQQGSGNELGNGQGQGNGMGQGQGDGQGSGQNMPGAHGKHGSGKGNGGSGGGGMAGGKPADTGQGSTPTRAFGSHVDPSKNPKYGKLYLGRPSKTFAGPSMNGPMRKVGGSPSTGPGQSAPSSVPYYNYVAPAAKSAESAMDKEDIPPSYRSDVRKYFNSLQPSGGAGK